MGNDANLAQHISLIQIINPRPPPTHDNGPFPPHISQFYFIEKLFNLAWFYLTKLYDLYHSEIFFNIYSLIFVQSWSPFLGHLLDNHCFVLFILLNIINWFWTDFFHNTCSPSNVHQFFIFPFWVNFAIYLESSYRRVFVICWNWSVVL